MERIKNTLKANRERILVATLSVAVGALGVYSVRTKNRLDAAQGFWAPIMEGLADGFVASLSEDRSMITLDAPAECHCPTTKTPKAKTAA